MTKLEKYAAMLQIIDAAICSIDSEEARKGALKAIRTAYNYAVQNDVVPRDEALRSANHRREVIAQWYPGQLPEATWEDNAYMDGDVDYSLDQLAEKEYEMCS